MPIARVGESNSSVQSWFRDIPAITKLLFMSVVFTGVTCTFGFIQPMTVSKIACILFLLLIFDIESLFYTGHLCGLNLV